MKHTMFVRLFNRSFCAETHLGPDGSKLEQKCSSQAKKRTLMNNKLSLRWANTIHKEHFHILKHTSRFEQNLTVRDDSSVDFSSTRKNQIKHL